MSEWREVKLKDTDCTFLSGYAFKSTDYSNKGIPLIKIGNIQNNAVAINENGTFINPDLISDKLLKYLLCDQDILIAMTGQGSVGRVGKLHLHKDQKALLNQRVGKFTTSNSELNIKYLYYVLSSEPYQEFLFNAGSGSGQPNLSPELILETEIVLPPLPEQQAIAEVLSSLDDKIDLLHRNNKTLEEMAETLFRQWFVDENTHTWTTVGDEFDVVMGQSPPGNTYNENEDGVPFYQGRTDFTQRFPSRRIFCSAPSRMAMAMDTLLSVRAPVGDTNIASEECCIGRGLAAIRHKDKTLHYSYTFLLFNFIKESFDVHEQSGTVFGSISKNELLELKCPRLSEPLMFNEKIAVIEDKVTHNSIQIETLSKLRNTLLPKLMSGQVRIQA